MIKKYPNIADYNSASDRSTSESEVALVNDGTGIKIHGVNVQVTEPQKGDIAYLDAARELKYILHDTYNAITFDPNSDVIGVVGEVIDGYADIIALDAYNISAKYADVYQWKVTNSAAGSGTLSLKHNADDAITYELTWTGVTATEEGKQALAQEIQLVLTNNANANWSCYYDADEEAVIMQLDNYTTAGFAVSCTGLTFTAFMDEVPVDSGTTKMRNGKFSSYPSWNHLRTAEWAGTNGTMTDDSEPTGAYPDTAIMSRATFDASINMKGKYGTYEEYCKATLPMYPRFDKGPLKYHFVGAEYTNEYGAIKYHKRDDAPGTKTGDKYKAMARVLSYQPTGKAGHSLPAYCIASAGNWHMADALELHMLLKDMNTTSANTTVANYDVVNRNLAAIGTRIHLAANFWSVVRLSAASAWYFNYNGMFSNLNFYNSDRALPLLTVKI